jgi:hypothetical protein
MPVVVADSNLVNKMPNGYGGPMARTIPNPMYPHRRIKPVTIPDSLKKKLFIQPNKTPKKN